MRRISALQTILAIALGLTLLGPRFAVAQGTSGVSSGITVVG